ncbi:hypothetical protein CDD82_2015 [Ophiocordyceps australis]|uniref:Zn(2)-C6 fungal-type domain-containing protein n=1 Tax=Ophiocordyceps australis TaxID=1399860 RepID=A0A2C5ZL68_9HYPO|nr:hypothetical protein CDD82_2015 [Ophiocordyceps australis]
MLTQAHAQAAEKKRRRPALACEQCRRRKIRCDRDSPCGQCVKAQIQSCTYAPAHVPVAKARGAKGPRAVGLGHSLRPLMAADRDKDSGSMSSPKTGSASDGSNVSRLMTRVQELERKLEGVMRLEHSHGAWATPAISPASTVSKTRYFGSSHWISVTDLLPREFALLGQDDAQTSNVYQQLVKCKALARHIKQNRIRPLSSTNIGKHIPPRQVADELVDNYVRTFEGVFRIVHVPSFRADYQRYWDSPGAANEAFVMQMQLCMALGSTVLDDLFSMRATAAQWVYEAQLWLLLPPEKSRLTFSGIQIMCLLVLAKSVCSAGQDLTWTMAGALVRQAMYMGFHRDPRQLGQMTRFRAEMRRRLWATVVELNFHSSFEAGGAPLLTSLEWDTLPPANLNDDQLTDAMDGHDYDVVDDSVPTQTSVQIAIVKSLPLRLELLRNANDFRASQAYNEMLRHNSELTKACRELSQKLSSLQTRPKSCITAFHTSMAEMLLYRCFHALHQSVVSKSFDDQRFYFSRKMCLDSALKLLHIWGLPGPRSAVQPAMDADLKRILITGGGMFRYIPLQAVFFIAAELVHHNKGQGCSLGYLPSPGSSDLRSYLAASVAHSFERIHAGETNCKGHCFVSATLSHVDALDAGLDEPQMQQAIVQATTASARACVQALEKVARREGLEEQHEALLLPQPQDSPDMQWDWMDDWAWDEAAGPWRPPWLPGSLDAMPPLGQF